MWISNKLMPLLKFWFCVVGWFSTSQSRGPHWTWAGRTAAPGQLGCPSSAWPHPHTASSDCRVALWWRFGRPGGSPAPVRVMGRLCGMWDHILVVYRLWPNVYIQATLYACPTNTIYIWNRFEIPQGFCKRLQIFSNYFKTAPAP